MNINKVFFSLTMLLIAACSYAQHPWTGKRVAYLGDSMTDPRNSSADCKYWKVLQDSLRIEPLVYAVSGYQWHNMMDMAQKLHQEHGQDVDAILIWCGTNDYNHSNELGVFYTEETLPVNVNGETVERKHRIHSNDEWTLCGEMNRVLSYLKETYPTKQIIIMTPIHRGYAHFSSKNVQPDEDYANGQDLYIEDYVDTIKRGAQLWSIPVIDLFGISGIYPNLSSNNGYVGKIDTDRLHPNNEGHKRIAYTIIAALNGISPL